MSQESTLTYAQDRGKRPFDWNAFLKRERYSEAELDAAYERAMEWVTCAVGNQCAVIARYTTGAPMDEQLASLGYKFTSEIRRMKEAGPGGAHYSGAKHDATKILAAVEIRSAELIKQIQSR